jgi:hypothetical protein
MTSHHVTLPEADFGGLQRFVEIPSGCGAPLLFDKTDSHQWSGKLFGLSAGHEREVHVLRGDYTPERWIGEEKRRRRDCQWRGPRCTERGNCLLTFSAGAWVVGVPSCWACEAWLLAGGSRNAPLTHLGLEGRTARRGSRRTRIPRAVHREALRCTSLPGGRSPRRAIRRRTVPGAKRLADRGCQRSDRSRRERHSNPLLSSMTNREFQ